jgi:TonB-dependent SusC/RagA subfamily outer membrane receptor
MTSQIVIAYIFKTILVSGIFFGYYWIALRDKKFHYYNRFYLLTASIMSLAIPLLKLNWFTVKEPVLYSSNEIVQFILPISNGNKTIQFNWVDYSLFIACIVAIALLSILILNVIKIQLIKRKCEVTKMDGFDFINTNEDNAPFSFLNNLFWKQSISLQEEVGQQIFKHEITHINQKHTWDRIYCQIVASIFWMNPFNWVIQKELVAIHEFIADEEAVGNSNVEAFAKMLLQTHYGNHFLNPTHQFFYSSIKRRLTMLTKSSNTKYSYLRRVMVLPILMVTVCLVSIKVNASEKIEKTAREIQNTINLLVSDTTKPKKITHPTPPTPPKPPTPPNPSSVKQDAQNKMEEVAVGDKKTPLYILDGVPLKSSLEVSKLNEEEFESISVLRNPSSISQYGNEGKNGVVIITTKTGLKGNLQNKSDETKVFEYSAKEGLKGDVYYKKNGDTIKVSNMPVKVTNVPVKVTIVPKIQKNVDPSKNN